MKATVTPNEVIGEANRVADAAMNELNNQAIALHEQGYHAWSAAVANLRHSIETALYKLVDEVHPS